MVDSSKLNTCEFKVSQKYLLRLITHNNVVRVECKEYKAVKSWNGEVKGVNAKFLSWLMEMPSQVGRFFFINPKTLEVAYCRGLLGGGSSPSRI